MKRKTVSEAQHAIKKACLLGLAGLLAIGAGAEAQAAMYKWVDGQGNMQYTQTPPPAGQFKELKPGPPPQAPEEAERQLQQLLARQRESAKQRETAAKDQEADEHRQAQQDQLCEQAKKRLAVLESRPGPRLGVVENGAVVRRMDEGERQTKLAETRKIIAESCTGN